MNPEPNYQVESNRRCISPLNAQRQCGSAWCAPPFLSVAVAHSKRSA